MYTLVMASFMLAGAKLGDILGRNRVFALGLAVYGIGSLTTSLSPSLSVLLVGWSGVEGLGAVMVIPAIFALTAANYEGKDRALAYALIGATVAIAVAAGPLIGGWVTTNYSWRWVFAGETVVVIILLLFRGNLAKVPRAEHPPKMDFGGAAFSAAGLGLIVFGILMSSTWGLITPRAAPTIGGTEITPLGFSVVPFLILAGLGFLAGLVALGGPPRAPRARPAARHDAAAHRAASRRADDVAWVSSWSCMGTFFVLPVYLQVVLGLDAFETGKRLLPLSAAMLVAALSGPRIAGRRLAEDGRADRPRGDQHRGGGDDGDPRRQAERDADSRSRSVLFRDRRGPAGLPARQRDHVVGRPVEDERDRRASGDRAEPRGIDRHRVHRRRSDRWPDEWVQQSD